MVMQTLPEKQMPDILDVILTQPAEKTFAITLQRAVSYGELRGRIAAISSMLSGFTLVLANDPIESMVYWLACYHRGVPCAIISPGVFKSSPEYFEQNVPYTTVLTDCDAQPKHGCTIIRSPSAIEEWQSPNPDRASAFLLLASSRTTGNIKLIQHLNSDLPKHHEYWVRNFPLVDGDVVSAPNQIPFGYGFIVTITWTVWYGKTVAFADGHAIHPQTTVSCVNPAELVSAAKLSNLRLAVFAGAHVPLDVREAFNDKYVGARLVDIVGATETLTCFLHTEDNIKYTPDASFSVRVVNADGVPVLHQAGFLELQRDVRPRYWNNPELQAKIEVNGWIRLGDFAIDNGDGTYRFLGRSTITFDVENALRADPNVRDCHFCLIDNKPVLIVVASISKNEIRAQLSSFSVQLTDDRIFIVSSIPRSENGKITRQAVEKILNTQI